jgi:hypothetical protein
MLLAVAAIGLISTIWSSLHEMVALLLGHDDPEAPPVVFAAEGDRATPQAPPRTVADAEYSALPAPIGGGR